ncbi:MAG TPA: hypothetical protein ENJ46_05370 [Hellea balneolensis]|uniref:Uncharacterized protein n=1 Tax=Hellea balneolensis TaxID=287478 RepID=A0A7C3GDT9_9PROT|nr:hypothetical protein [Hellea balneolensis]
MTDDLFRKEAIRHRTRALYGDVVLAAPLSTWLILAVLCALLFAGFAYLFWGHVDTDTGTISVWQWIFGTAS